MMGFPIFYNVSLHDFYDEIRSRNGNHLENGKEFRVELDYRRPL